MLDVSAERCVATFHARYPPTPRMRTEANPKAQGSDHDRAGATGGKRWFIHSPGSRLDLGDSCCAASAGSGAGFRPAMIVALRERGGLIGLSPSGRRAATD